MDQYGELVEGERSIGPAQPVRKKGPAKGPFFLTGGEGEIRTHGTLAGTTVFETVTIDHSVTSPDRVRGGTITEPNFACNPILSRVITREIERFSPRKRRARGGGEK